MTFLVKISCTLVKNCSNDIDVEHGSDSNAPANTGVNKTFRPLERKKNKKEVRQLLIIIN